MTSSICNKSDRITLLSDSRLFAKISTDCALSSRLSGISSISSLARTHINCLSRIGGEFSIRPYENINMSLTKDLSKSAIGNIRAYTNAALCINQTLLSNGDLKTNRTDKFAGYKPNFQPTSKFYPISDISFKNKITNSDITVRNNFGVTSNIYSNVDEGVFTGHYTQNNGIGTMVSDDTKTLIFPYYIFDSGDIQYKFRVNYPLANPKFSYFALRATSPPDQYSLRRPQIYKIYDITLEDPSGNLIIKYDDISIRGDNGFTTYISKPEINNADKPTWDPSFPYFDSGSPLFLETKPYVLTMNFAYECLQTPFNDRFDFGYEQTCIKDSLIYVEPNPFIGLRISSIEIGNSGGIGIKKDNYLNFFTNVRSKSERTKKIILPNKLFTTSFNNGVYPEASSIWRTPDYVYSNKTEIDAETLLQKIQSTNIDYGDYISLSGSAPYLDSGRLILKFSNDRDRLNTYAGGGFNFGGSNSFNDVRLSEYIYEDYFDIDYAELRVIARKPIGGSDYNIDIVGYSNDHLLHVTSPIGGFLQNSGSLPFDTNSVPNTSEWRKLNFGLSNSSISDQSEYLNDDVSRLGDHYVISNAVTVNSTDFKNYIVPLEIYQDPRKLGHTKYSLSSYFENLYVDICPIPSGASIAHVSLILYYKPANAFMMHTLGSQSNKNAIQKNITLIPESSGTISTPIKLSGILTGFSSPSYLKTNYSRRWRGHVGNILSGGDFKKSMFDFSFNHKQSDTPFLTSYVDFTKIDGVDIQDHKNNYFAQAAYINLLSNFGWRYSSNQLINGITTPYKSISWANNIYDSFDRALRIDSSAEMESPILNISNSFAFFIRYTPDKVANLDLENHLILSHENSSDWAMVLVVENGYLTLKIKDSFNDIYEISDNKQISEYSFPLSILVTHDSDNYNTFRLYTDHDSSKLRGSIFSHAPKVLSNPITLFDHSTKYSDQLPIPMFLHEIGFSSGCNIVSTNANEFLNQINVNDFFDSYNVLGNYIDDDISKWHLGDFKICQFSPDFDCYTKREGKDYITFTLNHHGSGYSQFTNKQLPSNINLSGVSYHTQIENDFLRFNISDIPDFDQNRFYNIGPRISKNLPKGYNFKEQTLYIDTILEHETVSNISWPNGQAGPKMIVSLYAPTQESLDRPSKSFGLVNRSIHYLEPSGCIRKLTTKFTFNDILDNSEPWASFDIESYMSEFKEKYFLDDINSMFLQYDLVYPSGSPYESKIKIHSANINAENAIYIDDNSNTLVSLYTSGENYQFAFLNLFAPQNGPSVSGGYPPLTFNLYINSEPPTTIHESGLKLSIDSSGYFTYPEKFVLHTLGSSSISTGEQTFSSMFGSLPINGIGLSVSGQLMTETTMPLHTYGMAYNAHNSVNLFHVGPEGVVSLEENLVLRIRGINPSFNAYPSSIMPLHVYNNQTIINSSSGSFSLYLASSNLNIFDSSGTLPLITLNYPISDTLANSSATIKWDINNIGDNITSIDNVYAYVDADDNIRGVDLTCYGRCN